MDIVRNNNGWNKISGMKMMKQTILYAGALAVGMMLGACELKDELKNETNGSSSSQTKTEMGYLDLGVVVDDSQNSIVARGTVTRGETVDTSNFPIEITGTDKNGKDFAKIIEKYELLTDQTVELPVGTYKVVAHSPGNLEKVMSSPYYYGATNGLSIAQNVTNTAEVTCKMKNTAIKMTYDPTFVTTFSDWTITLTDGNGMVLTYTNENMNPPVQYVSVEEEKTTSILMNVTATVAETGATITQSSVLTKPAESEVKEWVGSDQLNIQLKPTETPSGYVSAIKVNLQVLFSEMVIEDEIPVEVEENTGGGSGESGGGSGSGTETPAPTLSGDYLGGNELVFEGGEMPAVNVLMTVPGGIAHVYVKGTSTNADMLEALTGMGLTSYTDLVNCTNEYLKTLFTMPEENATSYVFSLGTMSSLLAMYPGTHQFDVWVVDKNGKEAKDTLKITIK